MFSSGHEKGCYLPAGPAMSPRRISQRVTVPMRRYEVGRLGTRGHGGSEDEEPTIDGKYRESDLRFPFSIS